MSYKLKLGVAIAAAALALPMLAAAQDPSTRTDIVIIGAVSSDKIELPVVYEDTAQATEAEAAADESTSDSSADLGHAVESE
jgi:hypothetical protein